MLPIQSFSSLCTVLIIVIFLAFRILQTHGLLDEYDAYYQGHLFFQVIRNVIVPPNIHLGLCRTERGWNVTLFAIDALN